MPEPPAGTADRQCPLFPLDTVLVPGGVLPLRIFEPRYLDMVRECARDDRPFGVCLLLPGTGEQDHSHHARVGTLAGIRDFYTLQDGLLGITAEGRERFRVRRTSVRDNGLMQGELAILDEGSAVAVPEAYSVLTQIVQRLMERVGGNYPGHGPDDLQDATWVGYRLTELLPLENMEKQVLLEINDPVQRLQRLLETLPRFQAGQGAG